MLHFDDKCLLSTRRCLNSQKKDKNNYYCLHKQQIEISILVLLKAQEATATLHSSIFETPIYFYYVAENLQARSSLLPEYKIMLYPDTKLELSTIS